jgi:hypothetical protein
MLMLASVLPPGMLHAVTTPTTAIAGGSHFFTYETLGLTAHSRRCEHLDDMLDNDSGTSRHVFMTLIRMAIALRHRVASKYVHCSALIASHAITDVPTENLVALYAMIQYPWEFVPKREMDAGDFTEHEYDAGSAALRFLDYLGACREIQLGLSARTYIAEGTLQADLSPTACLWPRLIDPDTYTVTSTVVCRTTVAACLILSAHVDA